MVCSCANNVSISGNDKPASITKYTQFHTRCLMPDSTHDIETLMRSRIPIILIETSEERRTVDIFRHLAIRLRQPVMRWSVASGLQRIDLDLDHRRMPVSRSRRSHRFAKLRLAMAGRITPWCLSATVAICRQIFSIHLDKRGQPPAYRTGADPATLGGDGRTPGSPALLGA